MKACGVEGTNQGLVAYSSQSIHYICRFMLVLNIQVYSEGSSEPSHLLSLISAFAIHLHRVWN